MPLQDGIPQTMEGSRIAVLTTTVSQAEEADRLAALALAERLAACVQVAQVHSHYRWQGALQRDVEWRLDFKTAPQRVDALLAFVQKQHPYELPELVVQACWVSQAYAAWVLEQTAPAP